MSKPLEYSEEIANAILQRIMDGEMLSVICKEDGMPSRLTFYRWMNGRAELKNAYARARLAWADYWAERIMLISVNPDGAVEADGKVFLDNAAIMWAKHLTDNAKWLVGKYAPRTYGDKPPAEDDQPKTLSISWQKIERVIVDPARGEQALAATPAEVPRRLAYQPTPPPADLSPEAWAAIARVSELIERIAPGDETPEHVFGLIEGFLRAQFVAPKIERVIVDAPIRGVADIRPD